jgi:hypothetical protein
MYQIEEARILNKQQEVLRQQMKKELGEEFE